LYEILYGNLDAKHNLDFN